jgi:tubulin-specific chaperone A
VKQISRFCWSFLGNKGACFVMEKQLKIALGSCKRLLKEVSVYEKECSTQETRIEKLRAVPERDDHMIAKQEEVLEESRRMIPDTQRRYGVARDHLEALVAEARNKPDDTDVLTEVFAESEMFLKTNK